MVLDTLAESERYERLHPGFRLAFEYLRSVSLQQVSEGRHAIDGERVFAIAAQNEGRGRSTAKLEVHRRYIDIQYCAARHDVIGWRPLTDCHEPEGPFDESRDIQFFADRPLTWIDVPPGTFAIFYPGDAHAPLGGEGEVFKVVVKVAVDWPTPNSGG
jgi:YhcH/YjgK/YiaL family protein